MNTTADRFFIKLDRFFIRLVRTFWIVFSLVSLSLNVFIQISIVSKFRQIFHDVLPGRPLPAITQFILTFQIELVIFAIALMFLGLWIFYSRRTLWSGLILFVIAVQIGVTIFALFLPLIGVTIYLSQ